MKLVTKQFCHSSSISCNIVPRHLISHQTSYSNQARLSLSKDKEIIAEQTSSHSPIVSHVSSWLSSRHFLLTRNERERHLVKSRVVYLRCVAFTISIRFGVYYLRCFVISGIRKAMTTPVSLDQVRLTFMRTDTIICSALNGLMHIWSGLESCFHMHSAHALERHIIDLRQVHQHIIQGGKKRGSVWEIEEST